MERLTLADGATTGTLILNFAYLKSDELTPTSQMQIKFMQEIGKMSLCQFDFKYETTPSGTISIISAKLDAPLAKKYGDFIISALKSEIKGSDFNDFYALSIITEYMQALLDKRSDTKVPSLGKAETLLVTLIINSLFHHDKYSSEAVYEELLKISTKKDTLYNILQPNKKKFIKSLTECRNFFIGWTRLYLKQDLAQLLTDSSTAGAGSSLYTAPNIYASQGKIIAFHLYLQALYTKVFDLRLNFAEDATFNAVTERLTEINLALNSITTGDHEHIIATVPPARTVERQRSSATSHSFTSSPLSGKSPHYKPWR